MNSSMRRRVAALAVLPTTVTLLGLGLAGPALAGDIDNGNVVIKEQAPSEGKENDGGLKIADLGNTGRLLTDTAGNVF